MKKHLILTSLLAIVATTGAATADSITMADIKNSMNMTVSDGSYTIGESDYNVKTDDYSTSSYYSLYTYDHDGNDSTDEIALTSNDKSETLDLSVFTYTDNNGAETDLATNSTGFVEDDFKVTAGTVDVAHGTTNLTDLEVDGTVGVSNYQYLADFTDSGTETLTALTAEEPTLDLFSKTIDLANGEQLVVTGNSVENKPNETQYGFEIAMDNGETGVFGIEWNEGAQQYNYIYKGHKEGSSIVEDDYALTETDKDNAKNAVTTEKGHLLADIAAFDAAITTNQANFDSAKEHYDAVYEVYEVDAGNQDAVNTNWANYTTSFGAANTAKGNAQTSLTNAQNDYAADLAVYNTTKNAYDNYEASLGKVVDTRAEAVAETVSATTLADAKDYADSLAGNYDVAGAAATAESNAKDYADSLAGNYDVAGAAATAESNAKDYADDVAATAEQNAKDYTDTEVGKVNAVMGKVHGLITADESGVKTFNGTNATASTRLDDNGNYVGDLAVGTTVEDHLVSLDNAIGAEVDARIAADTALQTKVDNEVARATAQETAIRGEFAAADAATLANANAYTNKKVDTLEKNVSGGVAAATALSAVSVSNVGKGEVSVGGGYGYYNSQSAVAFGAAMGLSDRWSVNAGAGIASGDKTQVSFRAGTNYKFKLF